MTTNDLLGLFRAYREGVEGSSDMLADAYREAGQDEYAQVILDEGRDREARVRQADMHSAALAELAATEEWDAYVLAQMLVMDLSGETVTLEQVIRKAMLGGEDPEYIRHILTEEY
jgi:wobble nucleotide-excising tRNase